MKASGAANRTHKREWKIIDRASVAFPGTISIAEAMWRLERAKDKMNNKNNKKKRPKTTVSE